jgi:hypothetical protein
MKNETKNKYKLIKIKFGYQLEINGELTSTWFGKNMSQDKLDELSELIDKTQHLLKRV